MKGTLTTGRIAAERELARLNDIMRLAERKRDTRRKILIRSAVLALVDRSELALRGMPVS